MILENRESTNLNLQDFSVVRGCIKEIHSGITLYPHHEYYLRSIIESKSDAMNAIVSCIDS